MSDINGLCTNLSSTNNLAGKFMSSNVVDDFIDKFNQIEFKFFGIYIVLLLFVLFPNYNWLFRNATNFLMEVVAVVSIPVFLFLFIKYMIKRDFKGSLFCIAFALFVFWSGMNADAWRYELTNMVIQGFYCNLEKPINHEDILGGILELSSAEDIELGRTGAFVNSSHCLIVSCKEEFYYCEESKIEIYR
jgi:hypothetical protein